MNSISGVYLLPSAWTPAAKAGGKRMLLDYFPALHNGRNMQNGQYNPDYRPKQPGFGAAVV